MIEYRACDLFRLSLQWVAGAVREWWSELEHPIANLVARIASDHVSPLLIAAELKAVQNYSDSTMTITVSHQAREIIANYPIDDTIVQLALNVPPNYPLGTIKVRKSITIGFILLIEFFRWNPKRRILCTVLCEFRCFWQIGIALCVMRCCCGNQNWISDLKALSLVIFATRCFMETTANYLNRRVQLAIKNSIRLVWYALFAFYSTCINFFVLVQMVRHEQQVHVSLLSE